MKKKLAELAIFDHKTRSLYTYLYDPNVDMEDPLPEKWLPDYTPQELIKSETTLYWVTAKAPKKEGTIKIVFRPIYPLSSYWLMVVNKKPFTIVYGSEIENLPGLNLEQYLDQKKITMFLTPVF